MSNPIPIHKHFSMIHILVIMYKYDIITYWQYHDMYDPLVQAAKGDLI